MLIGASAASASCTVPNQLTNGQTADATQVMNNFNALAGCVNNAPAGSANAVQINAGGAFSGVGPLQDGQLVIGASSGAPVPAYLTAGSGITITNAPGGITVSASTSPGSGTSGAPEGRLTLTSKTPVMSADVVGASMVYYDCYVGKGVPYYNGSVDVWGSIGGCEISTALQTSGTGAVNSGDVFDIFFDGVHICVATNGSGAGWSGDTGGSITARGTGYSSVQNVRGYWTNAKRLLNCYNGATNEAPIGINQATYLGSLLTTAPGQTTMQFQPASVSGGTNNVLGLWNAYNQVAITTVERDAATWNYTTQAWRPLDGSTANRVSWVDGLGASPTRAEWYILDQSGANGYDHFFVITTDTTNLTGTFPPGNYPISPDNYVDITGSVNTNFYVTSATRNNPLSGVHYYQLMENNNGGGSATLSTMRLVVSISN